MVKSAFAHVGLNCTDPEKVERFYTKYFGFKRVRVVPLGDEQIVFTRSGNLTLEIFKAKEDSPAPPPTADGYPWPGLKHLAFDVENVDKFLSEIGSDADITLGPIDFSDFLKGWKGAWLADPEGNIIEISQGYAEDSETAPMTV